MRRSLHFCGAHALGQMSERPTLGRFIRAVTFVIVPLTLMLALPTAMALWPDSEYAPVWETVYAVLVLLAFTGFAATRFRKK